VKFKEAGVATLGSINVWFDDKFGRLNNDGKGIDLGSFDAEDRILVFTAMAPTRLPTRK
jgi:topoisomerase-4 subunit A